MFTENPNFKKLHDQIYVWENFLTEEEQKKYYEIADSISEEEWGEHDNNPNPFWNGKLSRPHREVFLLGNKINEILQPEFMVPPVSIFTRTPIGQGMGVHIDRGDEDLSDEYFNDFETCCHVEYGLLTYFGDWEGGELYYPDLDFSFKPKPGDLIIHSALPPYAHGVHPVTSGKRYLYANFAYTCGMEWKNTITSEKHIGPYIVDINDPALSGLQD